MSNRIEELYIYLKKQLIATQENPFKRRLILVPDSFVKAYLQTRLSTEESKIAMGIEIALPKQAIERILGEKRFFSYLDLFIGAYQEPVETTLSLERKELLVLRELQKAKQAAHIAALDSWYGLKKEKEPSFIDFRLDEGFPDEIFLFGISSLCTFYHHFFCAISKLVPTGYFILSPCMMFWGDICSDREAQKLKQAVQGRGAQEAFYELVMDRSLLLANCGKIGREFSALLEETVIHSEESYIIQEWALDEPLFSEVIRAQALSEKKEDASPSLLGVLQNSLLCLTGKSVEKIALADTSVQVHAIPSLLREIEVLYREIGAYSKEKELLWGEIVVLAPDIELYRPYIERLFGSGEVPYQIFGSKTADSSALFSFFWQILQLPGSHWSADLLFNLFGCKAIRRKFDVASEDLAGVYACMKEGIFQSSSTFSSFIDRMVFLWTSSSGKQGHFEIDSSLGTALGVCIHIIQLLQSSFCVVQEDASLESWATFFEAIFTDYFDPDLKDQKEATLIKQAIVVMKRCGAGKGLVSFFAAREFLKEAFEELLSKEETVIQMPIVFSSIGKMSVFSGEMTCLIGMNEGLFPRQEKKILINDAWQWVGKSEPSSIVIDKYHFINAVLATRKTLYLSFQSYSYEERAPLEPSSCVLDLLQTLDDCCTVKGELPSKAVVFSHSLTSFRFIPQKKQEAVSIICCPQKQKNRPEETIAVAYLAQVAKSPLRPYFQQTVSLYLAESKYKRLNDPFATVETMTRAIVKKRAFSLSAEEMHYLLEKETKSMPEAIQLASISLFTDEIRNLHEAAHHFGVNHEQVLKIELLESSLKVHEVAPGHWQVPALSFCTEEGKSIRVVGLIDDLYHEGHLFFGSQSEKTLARNWPKILLSNCIAKTYDLPIQSNCYFLKDKKRKEIAFENPETLLRRYIQHALDCKTEAICLYPDWVPDLLKEKEPEGQKVDDAYLQFFLSRTSKESLSGRWPLWQARAASLFEEGL